MGFIYYRIDFHVSRLASVRDKGAGGVTPPPADLFPEEIVDMGYLVLKDVIVSIHHFPPTTGKLQRHSPRAIFTRAVFVRRHGGLDERGKLYQA